MIIKLKTLVFCENFIVRRRSRNVGVYLDPTCLPHYANVPMRYTAILTGVKSDIFQLKKIDNLIVFLYLLKT